MVKDLSAPPTVLIIDDEESIREGCRQIVEGRGYRAEVAADGDQGVRLVRRERPNVVLVDLRMPGRSGMEVIREIHQLDASIAQVVITGYATPDSAVQTMRLGVVDYLAKPFDDEKLLGAVDRGLESSRRSRNRLAREREAEMVRENYAAVVCHQLKSPVSAIAQYLEVINAGLVGELTVRQKAVVDRMSKRIEDLQDIIRGWLRVAGLDSGAWKPEFREVLLPAVIWQAWDQAVGKEHGERISLQMATEKKGGIAWGDAHLLCELFRNLFDNAVKFVPEGGVVRVGLTNRGSEAIISVSDSGPGIPDEVLPRIFEPFFRASHPGAATGQGTGLGLAICRRIAEAHGGTITAGNSPGLGTCFNIGLPAGSGGKNQPS